MSQEPKERKCDGKDHLVKRKEDMKEQADWHHTQLRGLLRNDIKEILKELVALLQEQLWDTAGDQGSALPTSEEAPEGN